jgi:flagellar motor switch protein FliG
LQPLARRSPPARPGQLTRRQKAAIIVRFLLQEGADMPLKDLPEEMQSELTQLMGSMRYIDRATLEQVVGEFADELESMGLTFPRGLAGALSALDGKISPQTAARLRKEAGVRRSGDPWSFIRELEVDKLRAVIERESTEVSAVLLAKLPVGKAAELLGKIPGDRARRITYAMSLTEGVTPEAVDRIGLSLAAQFEMEPLRAFEEGPDARLGSILNITDAGKRDEVLTGLDEDDAAFSQKVRKAIFTFQHIPTRIYGLDVPKIVRDADADDLKTALAYALNSGDPELKETVEFLLGNISKRMAANMEEEAIGAGKVKKKEGELAMNSVVTTIRELQQNGELNFVETDEEEG